MSCRRNWPCRESRLRKLREARAALEAEALAEAEQAEREGRNHPGVPDDKAQRNFTDPDSRIIRGPGGRDFQQSYNCPGSGTGQLPPGAVAARATDLPSDEAAGGSHGGGDHPNVGRGADRSICAHAGAGTTERARRAMDGPSTAGTWTAADPVLMSNAPGGDPRQRGRFQVAH